MRNPRVTSHDWGMVDYAEALARQARLFEATVGIKNHNRTQPTDQQLPTPNHLVFCQHPPVYTLGKSGDAAHLLLPEAELTRRGIQYVAANRGGDITFHGPGQLVGYPILDLENFFTDIHRYLRTLEEAIIRTLADYGVSAGRIAGLTGVWLDYDGGSHPRKICAFGVRASRWVTMHGFALNANTDLDYFGHIVPCGIADKAVTSLAHELGAPVNEADLATRVRHHLTHLFAWELVGDHATKSLNSPSPPP